MGDQKSDKSSQAGCRIKASTFGNAINDLLKVNPQLAAEQALMKFLRPERMVPSTEQRKFLGTAETTFIDVDGIAIMTCTWSRRQDSTVVLHSHGFLMTAATILNFVQPLLRAGFKVITWDHCAHGESGGETADMRVWMQTILTIARRNAPLSGIVGFSVGGTAALMACAQNPEIRATALCCLNPPTQTATMLSKFLDFHGCNAELFSLIPRASLRKGILLPEHLPDVLSTNNQLSTTKVLIVQDRQDTIASVQEAKWLAAKLPQSELQFTQGLGHTGALSDRDVIQAAAEFMTRNRMSVLPETWRL